MTTTELAPPVENIDDGERWLPAVGHEESYLISSLGRLWSRIHHKLLAPAHGRRVVLAGQPRDIGALVLETHGGQPRPATGMIAWSADRAARWPYSVGNLKWITRAEMLTILSRERSERARRPQAGAELVASS
jgi:hypothetical protein